MQNLWLTDKSKILDDKIHFRQKKMMIIITKIIVSVDLKSNYQEKEKEKEKETIPSSKSVCLNLIDILVMMLKPKS